ncbi:MAG TPA: hypothetical protein ENI59_00695, partial [Euryarchaeota archaeon]|nr:hypothetical protein [Euryarchaeota archaeon]
MTIMIRGIYATALTKILLDNNFPISNPSKKIQERFGDVFSMETPKANILHTKNGIMITGDKEIIESVVSILKKYFPTSAYVKTWLTRPIYKGIIVGKDGPFYKVEVQGKTYNMASKREYSEGDIILGTIVGSEDAQLFSDDVYIQGKYVAVYLREGGIKLGKGIKSQREDLERLLSLMDRSNLEIFVKNSAENAEVTEVLEDVQECVNKAIRILSCAEKTETGLVGEGEYYYQIIFSLLDLLKLDEIRNSVVKTLKYHHLLKNIGKNASYIVDVLESGDAPENVGEYVYKGILKVNWEKSGGPSLILHRKLTGEVYTMRGFPRKVEDELIVIERFIKTQGTYDGLNAPKEPGDYVLTHIYLNKWWLRHEYYSSDGKLKGIYYNINT